MGDYAQRTQEVKKQQILGKIANGEAQEGHRVYQNRLPKPPEHEYFTSLGKALRISDPGCRGCPVALCWHHLGRCNAWIFAPFQSGNCKWKYIWNYEVFELKRVCLVLAMSWQVLSCTEAKITMPSFVGYPGVCCTPFTFQ